ncbi:MAG TPA: 50S ribosomal protein L9 [Candidatus Limnocylindria bacterium]|jgi:large subunit ribosomal protein L9
MRVVLKQEVRGLGRPGEVKDVADGYAQNFLLPRGLAIVASTSELKRVAQQRDSAAHRVERAHAQAEALAKKLDAVTLVFKLKAGDQGKAFGSVTTKDVSDALARDAGITVDRMKIHADPLRSLGVHRVEIRLLTDVRAHITVAIEAA